MAKQVSTRRRWPKSIGLKDVTVVAEQVVAAADGSAIHLPLAGGEAVLSITRDDPKGTRIELVSPLTAPKGASAVCALPERHLVVAYPCDRLVALIDGTGQVLGRVEHPDFASVVALAASPSGAEIAIVCDPGEPGLPTQARILRLSREDLLAGHAPSLVAERPRRPTIDYDAAGRLCWVDSRQLSVCEGDAIVSTPIAATPSSPDLTLLDPVHLSTSGQRFVVREHPVGGSYVVFDATGRVLRVLPGPLAERVALADGGRTLVLTAERAKSRTPSQGYVQWPDTRMLDSYVAWLEVDSGQVRCVVERSAGPTRALSIIDGDVVVVASAGRSVKVELFSWSELQASSAS